MSSVSEQCGDTPVQCENSRTPQRESPTEMVLALPVLEGGRAPRMQPSQDQELQKKYLELLQMKKELEEICKKKEELLCVAQKSLAEEQAKRERVEREKQLLEERCKELEQTVKFLQGELKNCRIQLTQTQFVLKAQDVRIRKLEVHMKATAVNNQNSKKGCTSSIKANNSEENNSEHSGCSKICDLIEELLSLIGKFFSRG